MFSFGSFHYDVITDTELDAKSQVLVIGQYSTGKTTVRARWCRGYVRVSCAESLWRFPPNEVAFYFLLCQYLFRWYVSPA